MVRKLTITILVILAVAAAFYLGYWFNAEKKTAEPIEEETNNQPTPVQKFEGPTSSPTGIKGPSGPPPR